MVDLKLGTEKCAHCLAEEDGMKLIELTEAQEAMLQDILEQVRDGNKAGTVAMSGAEQDDLHSILKQLEVSR